MQEEDLGPDSSAPSGLMPDNLAPDILALDSLAPDSLAQTQQALVSSTSAPPMGRFVSSKGAEPFEVSSSHAQLSSSARRRQSFDRGTGRRLSFHSSLRLSGQRGWSGAVWERGEVSTLASCILLLLQSVTSSCLGSGGRANHKRRRD